MTWSYSGSPSDSQKDEVRFYIGDTDTTFQLLSDEEIQFVIDEYDNIYGSPLWAAAVCAETIAARFAREVDVSADGVSVQIGELQARYNQMANDLRDQYKSKFGWFDPNVAESMLSIDWDPSIKPLRFGVGMNDNYLAGRQDYGDYHPGDGQGFPEVTGSNEPSAWGY